MNKSTKSLGPVLVSQERIEAFLQAVANPPAVQGKAMATVIDGHMKKFQEFYPALRPEDQYGPYVLTARIRSIWKEQDERAREWKIFLLRYRYLRSRPAPPRGSALGEFLIEDENPPEWSPFEQALMCLSRAKWRFRFCENPDCPAPYYVVATRKKRSYCSSICGAPAQRESKRKWWRENRGSKSTRGGKKQDGRKS